jgi:hypothetical protein
VRSVTHKASGRSAVKSRLTRSGARVASGSWQVVNTFLRARETPWMHSSRIKRATWSRPMSWPARRAAFHSLWAPYTLRFATHSAIRICIITASRSARADGDTSRFLAA